ncbi:unnamed protein product [Rotaria sp. Silwood1]|nr:unnamed protein product [Rotaria sp. Silwood1]
MFFNSIVVVKPVRFCQDDDFYPIACLSSSSSFFVDDKLLHNKLERTSITSSTASGQFLCIDHHAHCHSFVNDLYLIVTSNFHYHPSSSFIDPLLSIEYLRTHLASVYILITGSINEIFRPYSNLLLRIGNARSQVSAVNFAFVVCQSIEMAKFIVVDHDNILKMEKMLKIKHCPFPHAFRPTYPTAASPSS